MKGGPMDTDLVVCDTQDASAPAVDTRDVDALRVALTRENLERRRAECLAKIQTDVVKFAVDTLVREPDIDGFFRALLKSLAEEGESHKVTVWLNGKLTHQRDKLESFLIDSDRFAATLDKGPNRLLVRVASPQAPGIFHLRFRRQSGTASLARRFPPITVASDSNMVADDEGHCAASVSARSSASRW